MPYKFNPFTGSLDETGATGTVSAAGPGTAAAPSISFTGDTNTGIFSPGADQLAISTNGTERLFVDANGNIGVGTSSPANFAGFVTLALADSSGAEVDFIKGSTVQGSVYNASDIFYIESKSTVPTAFVTNGSERMRLTAGGLLGLGTSSPNYQLHVTTTFAVGASGFNQQLSFSNDTIQSLILGTGYTALKLNPLGGRLLVGTSSENANGGILQLGSGITFPATAVASADANTLDDYEEGTFTPTVTGGSTAGSGTYSSQVGKYVKIGGKVFVEVALAWSAHTGTGNMFLTGLPFTSAADEAGAGISVGRVNNLAITALCYLIGYMVNSNTAIALRAIPIGGGAEDVVGLDTAAEINYSITYMVV
jgi:hypothetical protein